MSLIGIDVGSSVTKVVAFAADGALLADASESVRGHRTRGRPVGGRRGRGAGGDLARAARRWPAPRRPARPADRARRLRLGPRGRARRRRRHAARAAAPHGRPAAPRASRGRRRRHDVGGAAGSSGAATCPDHMDPMNRLLWWRETRPRTSTTRTHQFHGWHELITRHLCGRAVSDHGIAGKFFAYDLATRDWSPALLRGVGHRPAAAARPVLTWGAPAGVDPTRRRRGAVAARGRRGRHRRLRHVVRCARARAPLGAGVLGLVVGSWESLVAPIDAPLPARDVIDGRLAVGPHAGTERPGRLRAEPERHGRASTASASCCRSRSSS